MTRMPIITGLALTVLLTGCSGTQRGPIDDPSMPAGDRKVALRAAIDQRFENPQAHYELAKIYRDEGLWDQAEYHFNVVTRIAPTHWPARAALVRLLTDRKRPAEASQAVRTFVREAANPAELEQLIKAFRAEGLNDAALEALQAGRGRWPQSALIYKQLGMYYLGQKDTRRAEEYLRQSFAMDHNQPEVAYELGKLGIVIEAPKPKTPPPPPSGSGSSSSSSQPDSAAKPRVP